jgi:hypothetical protein
VNRNHPVRLRTNRCSRGEPPWAEMVGCRWHCEKHAARAIAEEIPHLGAELRVLGLRVARIGPRDVSGSVSATARSTYAWHGRFRDSRMSGASSTSRPGTRSLMNSHCAGRGAAPRDGWYAETVAGTRPLRPRRRTGTDEVGMRAASVRPSRKFSTACGWLWGSGADVQA